MCCGKMHTVTVKTTGNLLTWEKGTVWHLVLYSQKCAGHCCSWFDSTHRQIQGKLITPKDGFSMCAFLSFHKGEAEPWRMAAIKPVRVSCHVLNNTQDFLPAEQERHRETIHTPADKHAIWKIPWLRRRLWTVKCQRLSMIRSYGQVVAEIGNLHIWVWRTTRKRRIQEMEKEESRKGSWGQREETAEIENEMDCGVQTSLSFPGCCDPGLF